MKRLPRCPKGHKMYPVYYRKNVIMTKYKDVSYCEECELCFDNEHCVVELITK